MHPTTDGMGAMARKDDAVQVQLLPLAGGYDVERLVRTTTLQAKQPCPAGSQQSRLQPWWQAAVT